MRIAHAGLNLPDGKFKYQDPIVAALVTKFQPAKTVAYHFEFCGQDYDSAQAIATAADRILDLLILDIEKIENRLGRTEDAAERSALAKCQAHLETEKPLCDLALDPAERSHARVLGLLSLKPTLVVSEPAPDPSALCRAVMEKAGMMFFYTVGKPEVHAWIVEQNADAVTCAGRIHTDLACGFIKADIFTYEDIMAAHNVQDARSRGLVKVVDRDFPVPENSIIEIRFNV
jgi:ribosome-binding ATPase YchF (GTP1/OBG family)